MDCQVAYLEIDGADRELRIFMQLRGTLNGITRARLTSASGKSPFPGHVQSSKGLSDAFRWRETAWETGANAQRLRNGTGGKHSM